MYERLTCWHIGDRHRDLQSTLGQCVFGCKVLSLPYYQPRASAGEFLFLYVTRAKSCEAAAMRKQQGRGRDTGRLCLSELGKKRPIWEWEERLAMLGLW